MLRLLNNSYDQLTISDPQGANHEKFKSFEHEPLRENGYNEGESDVHSPKYFNGSIQELGSRTVDVSPVVRKERQFSSDRAFSVERRLDGKRTNSISPILFETPRITGKTITLRRRLLESHLSSSENVELCKTLQSSVAGTEEWPCTRMCDKLSFSDSSLNSPGDLNFEVLSTSTLNNDDESGTSCRTKRYLFAQQRTSTIDDLKGKNRLISECATSDQCTAFSKLDLSSFSCSEDYDEITSSESFVTPSRHGKPKASGGDLFVTPVNFNVNLSAGRMLQRTPSQDKLDTPTEDSGYNSLGLEKSLDSFSNESSFQEMVKNQKRTPKMQDYKRSVRKLERTKRLSTLSERGSQSETEDEHKGILLKGSNCKLISPNKDDELVFEENNWEDSRLKFENFSHTPALQLIQELCMRKRKRLGNITAKGQNELEEKALDESMPSLHRLIGRKMGLEKVDILKELLNRNLTHVLTIILYCLTVEDICRVWKVSKVWKKIVKQDQALCLKRKQYLDEIHNYRVHNQPWAADAETRCNLPDRPALKSVQAQARVVFTPTPSVRQEVTTTRCSSASRSISKREEFLQVAKTLFNDEALKPCPRCQSPARYNPMEKRGLCSREDCAFDFCTQCFCVFHGSRECGSKSAKHFGNKGGTPGSAQSKRNLRRL
ncbi:F-box only protein 43-like [Pristis pectinata]|uniref:F-box only protein 43-like n=1 Tax=Pristis pectinata TaxID=685728 RepID=UPI00223E32E6|nr:F-box only protein 43-like [Pristis pectinata]